MPFNIKKGVVHGYVHNAPTIRDGSTGAPKVNNMRNAPDITSTKATKFITGKYNAPELIKQPSGRKVSSLLGQ